MPVVLTPSAFGAVLVLPWNHGAFLHHHAAPATVSDFDLVISGSGNHGLCSCNQHFFSDSYLKGAEVVAVDNATCSSGWCSCQRSHWVCFIAMLKADPCPHCHCVADIELSQASDVTLTHDVYVRFKAIPHAHCSSQTAQNMMQGFS